MTIKEIADRLAGELNHKDNKIALIAARAALGDQPTPPGLIYDENNLPPEIAATVEDQARAELNKVGGTDPLAKVKEAQQAVDAAQDQLEQARAERSNQLRAARAIGIPFKDLEQVTGFSRGYLDAVIKGNK